MRDSCGAKIKNYERDFSHAGKQLQQADVILFAYPVYTFLVPCQLHRFVELMKEETAADRLDLNGKYCTQISTSKHFYDVTAHKFIEDNSNDLGMRFLKGLSADMDDLTSKKVERKQCSF